MNPRKVLFAFEQDLDRSGRHSEYRILWVDDFIERFQDWIWGVFSENGVELAVSPGNDEALVLLEDETEHFDMMVQDFQRPPGRCLAGEDTEGYEITGIVIYEKYVKKIRPGMSCVFVIAEANDPVYKKRIEAIGNCRMINKPLRTEELLFMCRLVKG